MTNRMKQLHAYPALVCTLVSVLSCGDTAAAEARRLVEAAGATTVAASSSPASDSTARARQDSINRAQPGYVVDSILPPDDAMRRFTADIANPPSDFAHGAGSRDALVLKWVRALESNDSLTLIRTAISRPEFAFLVYPTSPSSKPPLQQPPDLAWLLLSNASVQGFRRSIGEHGGASLGYLGYACPIAPESQGSNRIWAGCVIRRRDADGDTTEGRLFGPIVEREGYFKFLSLAGDQ